MRALIPMLVLFGCQGGSDSGTVPDGTTDTPTDTDTGTPGGGTTTPTGDTGTPTPTETIALTDLAWELHPLVSSLAVVSWTQSEAAEVHVEYAVDPGVWLSTPVVAYEAGSHERIVAGIPYAHDAEWRVVTATGESADGPTITTGPLPAGMPEARVTVSDPTRWLPDGHYLLSSINERSGGWTGGTYWTFLMDRQARIVWAHKAPQSHWTLFATVAVTGDHFLWDEATYWSDFGDGEDGRIHRTYLDEEIEVIPTPGLHHAWVELPDGTLVWGSKAHGGVESLVEKAPGAKDEAVLWTCRDDWPNALSAWGECESNGIFYVESTNSFLYSFYTNNSVVEVDRATGESLWWAGDVPNGWDFVPPQSEFSWQHGISYTDTGTLLLSSEWDGGDGGPETTWLMEYEVDPVAGTLSLVWANDSRVRAETNGQAWRLANGNTLHICGSAGVLREVDTATGDDVWRVDFDAEKLLGQGQFVSDLYALLKPVE